MAKSGLCIGCGACVSRAAASDAAMRMDRYGQLKPSGPAEWRSKPTPDFARTCPFSPAAADEDALALERFPAAPQHDSLIGRFEAAYVGHVSEGGFRDAGSSGGMGSWTAAELLRTGMVDGVAHVAAVADRKPGEPLFRYRIARSGGDVRAGAKSRYYPVDLSDVIREIRAAPGRYAIVGVPCFVKTARLLCREEPVLRERIVFTLGLFCGHMKSARMADSFAWQMGVRPDAVDQIDYRLKDPNRPANWYTAQVRLRDGSRRQKDWWHMADGDWGAGFFQNAACNACDDVVAETADISFGDAWVEPYSSDGRGTNVVIVRSPALHALLRDAIAAGRLTLTEVDAAFVQQTQAAGFRQRREGLAFRLARRRGGVPARKRVAPARSEAPARRRMIYGMRARISAWSHPVFLVARTLRAPRLYLSWARLAVTLYHGLAYSRGRLGALLDRRFRTPAE